MLANGRGNALGQIALSLAVSLLVLTFLSAIERPASGFGLGAVSLVSSKANGLWDWGTMIKPLRLLSVPCSMIHLSFMDPSSCSTSNRIFADGRL
jgi:hypothetical protein